MASQITQADARKHNLQAQIGNMRSLGVLFEYLLSGDIINVKGEGAVGDGVTDDTAAIQAAIDAAEAAAPATVSIPPGTYVTSSTLTCDASKVAIVGAGPYQTIIRGNFAAGDILHIDGSAATRVNTYLADFRVTSSVSKSSGAGVHCEKMGRSALFNVIADGQDGNGNLWHGIWFNGVDFVTLNGFEARGQQDGIRVNGGNGSVRADLMIRGGKIASCTIGLHVTGDFGGLHVDATDIINNATNVDIDQDDVALKNREIFFGPGCLIDGSSSGPNVRIEDPSLGYILFSGIWNASAATHGIHIIDSGSAGFVHITGGRIGNCGTDGIRVDDANCTVVIDGGVHFKGNGGWGVNATVAAAKVRLAPNGLIFSGNSSGDVTWTTVQPQVGQAFNISIADDDVYSFFPKNDGGVNSSGLFFISEGPNAAINGMARFSMNSGTATITEIDAHAILDFTTGVLAGTTGVDGNLTVSTHTDGKIYIENRRGGTRANIIFTLIAAGNTDGPFG